MSRYAIFVDSFSAGLDDLTVKQARCMDTVLRTLDRIKRFSVFEATANTAIANTMTAAFQKGYVTDAGGAYPWTNVTITETGRAIIDAAIAQEKAQ